MGRSETPVCGAIPSLAVRYADVEIVFYRLLGEQFIDAAFRAARSADPSAKLCINDYNLDGPGAKVDAMISLVGRLQSRGVPIDCIGTQAHLILGQVGGVKTQLQRLAATGLDVMITELDIRIPKDVTSAKLAQQENDYRTVVAACTSISNCLGVTVWGVSDRVCSVQISLNRVDANGACRTPGSIALSPAMTRHCSGTITIRRSLPTTALWRVSKPRWRARGSRYW
jgi:GH35 family endo-1,4-beta-xylanase